MLDSFLLLMFDFVSYFVTYYWNVSLKLVDARRLGFPSNLYEANTVALIWSLKKREHVNISNGFQPRARQN